MAPASRRPGRDARLDDGNPLAGFLATRSNPGNRAQGSIRLYGPPPHRRRDHAHRRRALGTAIGTDLQRPGRLRTLAQGGAGLVGGRAARLNNASPLLRLRRDPAVEIAGAGCYDIEALLP